MGQDAQAWMVRETERVAHLRRGTGTQLSSVPGLRSWGGHTTRWASLRRCPPHCRVKSRWGQERREAVPDREKSKWGGPGEGKGWTVSPGPGRG